MSLIPKLLNDALAAHRNKQLDQAEAGYLAVLQLSPQQPDALHFLGVVHHQRKDYSKAVETIRQAIAINPNVASYHCNLGEALRCEGELEAAETSCRQALQLQPEYPEAMHNLGAVLLKQGKYQEAARSFRDLIRLRKDYAPGFVALGDALRVMGAFKEAIRAYNRALELNPNLDNAHGNLGWLLGQRGDLENGLLHCRKAVELNPQSWNSYHNLASLLLDYEEFDEALEMLDKALELNPESAQVCMCIGRVSCELGEYQDALTWYDRAVHRDPELLTAKCHLASVLQELGDSEQAAKLYEEVLAKNPKIVEAHSGLAKCRLEQGDVEGAVACHKAAVEIQPEAAHLHAALGHTLSTAGDLDAAVASHREAINLNPRCIAAHSGLATTLRGKTTDDELQQIETLLANPKITGNRRASLHFGLAQGYDGRSEYDKAAVHMAEANALEKAYHEARDQGYNLEEHTIYVNRLIEAFTPEYFERVKGFGMETRRPIFIVGMPRSGTTLTEQILASHPDVHGAGERRYLTQGFHFLPQAMGANIGPIPLLRHVQPEHVRSIAQWHLDRLQELDQGRKVFVVDKMPENFNLLGWMVTMFPNTRIIHCRRDVRDVALSCWITNFAKIRWANDQFHLADRINQYFRIMKHYRQVLPFPILDVDYEDMVADQEGTTRKMLEFVGLEWNDACLNFHKTERLVKTASVAQVRQPIYKKSVARWKHYEQSLETLLKNLAIGDVAVP